MNGAFSKNGRILILQPKWFISILASVIIVFLHLFFLFHAGGFCGDEVDVINLAGSSSLSLMARDSFPVLMPLLVKGWTAIGLADDDLHLRLLCFFIGLGMIAALWLSAWTARRAPPLLGLTLFGLNGTAIVREDYLRAYGIGSVLVVLTMSAAFFLLKKPSWKRAALLSVAGILSVQTLFQNAVFFAAIGAGAWAVCFLRKDKNTAVKIFAAGMAAAISLLPYVGTIFKWSQSGIPRPGLSLAGALNNLNTLAAFPLPQYVWIWVLLTATIIASGAAVFFWRSSPSIPSDDNGLTPSELRAFAGATLSAAIVGYFIFLHFAALITSPWYFLPLLAIGAACFDAGIPSLTKLPRLFRAPVWGILIGTICVAAAFSAHDLNCRFTNVDLIVKRLAKETSPQDYIVVTPWYFGISFNHYYKGPATWDTLPPVADHSSYSFNLIQVSENNPASRLVLDRIAKTLQSGHRVWIVGLLSIPPPGKKAHTIAGQFIADHSQFFEQLQLSFRGRINDYEDESLLVASGWRENTASKRR